MYKYKIGDHIKLNIPTLLSLKGYTGIDVLANSICTITGISSCFSNTVDRVVPTYKIKEYDHWIPEDGIAGIVYESNEALRYKVGDTVLVCIDPRKMYKLQVTESHLKYNNLRRDIRIVDYNDSTYVIGDSNVWFSEDMLQPVDDTSYSQVSYVKDSELKEKILDYAKEIDKVLFPEKPDVYRIFQDRDTKAYIVDTKHRATIDLFGKFGLHPLRDLDKYIGDLVGYDPIELASKSCGGVKSLIDLYKLWRQFYTDVHNKYRDTGTPIVFDPSKFTTNKKSGEDTIKIVLTPPPTIIKLNFDI